MFRLELEPSSLGSRGPSSCVYPSQMRMTLRSCRSTSLSTGWVEGPAQTEDRDSRESLGSCSRCSPTVCQATSSARGGYVLPHESVRKQAQRGRGTCPRSHSQEVASQDMNPASWDPTQQSSADFSEPQEVHPTPSALSWGQHYSPQMSTSPS